MRPKTSFKKLTRLNDSIVPHRMDALAREHLSITFAQISNGPSLFSLQTSPRYSYTILVSSARPSVTRGEPKIQSTIGACSSTSAAQPRRHCSCLISLIHDPTSTSLTCVCLALLRTENASRRSGESHSWVILLFAKVHEFPCLVLTFFAFSFPRFLVLRFVILSIMADHEEKGAVVNDNSSNSDVDNIADPDAGLSAEEREAIVSIPPYGSYGIQSNLQYR